MTTSLYYPPKHYDINFKQDDAGNRISGTGGVVPDVEVPSSPKWTEEFDDKRNDNQLAAALKFLRAKVAGKSAIECRAAALNRETSVRRF